MVYAFKKTQRINKSDITEKSEFSPWARIFNRMEDNVERIEICSREVRFKNSRAIRPMLVYMTELYDSLCPMLSSNVEIIYNKRFEDTVSRLKVWEAQVRIGNKMFPEKLVDELQTLKKDVLNLKQSLGLGVPSTKQENNEEKLNKALGITGKKQLTNLKI